MNRWMNMIKLTTFSRLSQKKKEAFVLFYIELNKGSGTFITFSGIDELRLCFGCKKAD